MLLRGGAPVLSAGSARAMTSGQLTPEQKARGGLGTSWLVDPAHDLTVIVLTQRMFETSDPPQVHRDIRAAAYAALA